MADTRSSSESRVRRRAAARRIEAERIAKIRDQVKKHFTTNYHLKFDRYVGDGSHGGTGVFTALNPQSRGPIETEKYILKFSLGTLPNGEDSDEHLRNEASWLGYLSGSEHFIKSLYVNHLEVGNATGNGGGSGNAGGSGSSGSSPGGSSGGSSGGGAGGTSARSPGSGLGGDPADTSGLAADLSGLSIEVPARTRGHSDNDDDDDDEHDIIPALILEYLPMGDLETLRERLVAYGKPVPSRLLWGFALCLMRMCVGLAYYDFMEPGKQEEVPGGAVKPSTLCHNSIKGPNILLDGLRPDGEHGLTPLLKLIDFGRTGLVSEPREDYADGPLLDPAPHDLELGERQRPGPGRGDDARKPRLLHQPPDQRRPAALCRQPHVGAPGRIGPGRAADAQGRTAHVPALCQDAAPRDVPLQPARQGDGRGYPEVRGGGRAECAPAAAAASGTVNSGPRLSRKEE
ncbi:hypothetical protein SCUP515_02135 [Seiridium cupressi]